MKPDSVYLKVVWDTTHSNLPPLKTFIQSILAVEQQDEDTAS